MAFTPFARCEQDKEAPSRRAYASSQAASTLQSSTVVPACTGMAVDVDSAHCAVDLCVHGRKPESAASASRVSIAVTGRCAGNLLHHCCGNRCALHRGGQYCTGTTVDVEEPEQDQPFFADVLNYFDIIAVLPPPIELILKSNPEGGELSREVDLLIQLPSFCAHCGSSRFSGISRGSDSWETAKHSLQPLSLTFMVLAMFHFPLPH